MAIKHMEIGSTPAQREKERNAYRAKIAKMTDVGALKKELKTQREELKVAKINLENTQTLRTDEGMKRHAGFSSARSTLELKIKMIQARIAALEGK